jgi:centrosomal CEP192-like protein/ASPM-SPD-2-Hydin domain-containing protein
MRLPQPILHCLSVRSIHLLMILTIACAATPADARSGAQQLSCTPSSLHFGDVAVGQSETLLATLTNNGSTSVVVSKISSTDSEMEVSQVELPTTLAAGQSMEASVTFTPTVTGWVGGSVVVTSTASNPSLSVGLAGTGVSSEGLTASPASVSFGQVAVGATATVPVVLTNDRTWKVTVTALQTTGTGFSLSGPALPVTLSGGQSVTVNVTFAPRATGTDGGSLSVSGPLVAAIPLTGTGTVTQYSVSLSWNYTADVVGYNVYRGTSASGKYSKINSTLDANTAYTDSTVVSGQTYYYACTSVNASGQESGYSALTEAVVP